MDQTIFWGLFLEVWGAPESLSHQAVPLFMPAAPGGCAPLHARGAGLECFLIWGSWTNLVDQDSQSN